MTVRLRPWKETDLLVMMDVRNDVELQAQLLARVRGSDETQVRQWLQERSSGADSLFFIVADRESDAAIGFIQLTRIDTLNRCAELGICLIREWHSRGAGSEALRLVFPYLRDSWGLRKLNLRVRVDNIGAIHCYRKAGFQESGRLREDVYLEGKWHDLVLMELFLDGLP